MDYFFCLLMMFMVVGVMVLSMTLISYHGVISLMGFVFLCCVFMSIIGRTFVALVMYIVYLGGLIVVFSYCISVEKDRGVQSPASNFFMYFFVCAGVVVYLWIVSFLGVGGWLVEVNQDCFVCIGVNGFGVLYSSGGFGLIVCSWILFITLFSILVILSWYRRGGLRSF
uniref:NADH-ubiquinone oxidoreductase chain 6 n=1 Tax=Boa constrictor TaxID=8574 RepID=Q402P6_BOACO|nr:NADH dehydrogenase subunit 6 [Boa constrictor]BAE19999.1 NADH dehydrogenase subunit 6 [Boa constrictor]